jgi:hypothetical protein
MNIVPFVPTHLKNLVVNSYVGFIQEELTEEYGLMLFKGGAHTIIVDGKVIGCAGILQTGKNRWQAWALLSEASAPHMLGITRAANSFLDNYEKPRIETHVRVDFKQGNKFAKLLKFKNETPDGMKNYGDDGCDYYLYSRCA